MCFSATASFSAGTGLAAIGIMALRHVKIEREYLLASVPLLFALQQFIEGSLWLVLLQGKWVTEQYWLTHFYVGFVGIVWPLVIPMSIFLIEPDRFRRRLILLPLAVGISIASYTLYGLISSSVNAVIMNHCIQYVHTPAAGHLMLISYVFATCAAFFCSSIRSINIMGVLNTGVFLIADYSYEINFISGWCFFAAVVSGLIYLHFRRQAIITEG